MNEYVCRNVDKDGYQNIDRPYEQLNDNVGT
jgi:hypothetical protein